MEHRAAWKPLTKALKSKGVRNERREKKEFWLHFTCQWHSAGALLCVCVWLRVSVCLCVYKTMCVRFCPQNCLCVSMHVCTYMCVLCAHSWVCYAWRHTCSNRVVVDSDSCPVPFTAQSSQPPLCSVRLLMRINVLWRPLGLPHSPLTAQLMKKYNLAKILRWRERATQTEKDWDNTREGETEVDKQRGNKNGMQKRKPGESFWGQPG